MRKPAFAYFYGLYILISFSLLTITVRGVSNKHCLLPFFIYPNMLYEPSHNLRKPVFQFPTRSDTNMTVQPQKIVRVLKFRIAEVEGLYYLFSEN